MGAPECRCGIFIRTHEYVEVRITNKLFFRYGVDVSCVEKDDELRQHEFDPRNIPNISRRTLYVCHEGVSFVGSLTFALTTITVRTRGIFPIESTDAPRRNDRL